MSISKRNNIHVYGVGPTIVFAHGFGCDQNMWRLVAPDFEEDYRVVLFDHVGAGKSDISQYEFEKYDSLQGYADDLVEVIEEIGGTPVVLVGHSVSAMIGILAAKKRPAYFKGLILIGPSPCYINKDDYRGGFTREDIEGLLQSMESNYFGWSSQMAPAIMANPDKPQLGEELYESFCRTDPAIAKHFARVTFLSDNRSDLSAALPPSLIMQCSEDLIAPDYVGEYVHSNLRSSTLVHLKATGHCPHLSAPSETISEIRRYLASM